MVCCQKAGILYESEVFMSKENLSNIKITPEVENEILKLDNQLCFAFYVCSKEIVKKYRPFLEPLGLTYTSYITMMALWEQDKINVKDLGEKLYLDSGTLTPLLKKLESQGFVTRTRSKENERNVYISLTEEGQALKKQAAKVPFQIGGAINCGMETGVNLKNQLHGFMELITK